MRLGLRAKLQGAFAGMLLLTALAGGLAFQGMVSVADQYQTTANKANTALKQISALESAEAEQANQMSSFLLTGDQQYINGFNSQADAVQKALTSLSSIIKTKEGTKLLDRVKKSFADYIDQAKQIQPGTLTDGTNVITFVSLQNFRNPVKYALVDLTAYQQKAVDKSVAQVHALATQTQEYIGITLGVALLVGLLLAWRLPASITRPVKALTDMAVQVARGDLHHPPLPVRTQDEVGQLTGAFNQMLENLKNLVVQIQQASAGIFNASHDLTGSAAAAAQVSETTAGAVTSLVRGADAQAEQAREINRTLGELHETIEQIAEGATQSAHEAQNASDRLAAMAQAVDSMVASTDIVEDAAQKAVDKSRSSSSVVAESLAGMEHIGAATAEAGTAITELHQLSSEVTTITSLISEIAKQTNLLALNAAIEAARAGEHGRGFAVVAEEVRRLAARSADSARQIATLIQNIQVQVDRVVTSMARASEQVDAGKQLSVAASDALEEILETVEDVLTSAQTIASATAQVRSGTDLVLRAFTSVAAITEEHTAATEEMSAGVAQLVAFAASIDDTSRNTASAVGEISASTEDLTINTAQVSEAAAVLTDLAERLRAQVQTFSV